MAAPHAQDLFWTVGSMRRSGHALASVNAYSHPLSTGEDAMHTLRYGNVPFDAWLLGIADRSYTHAALTPDVGGSPSSMGINDPVFGVTGGTRMAEGRSPDELWLWAGRESPTEDYTRG